MKKKLLSLILAIFCFVGMLTGCGNSLKYNTQKKQILCTIFPLYDWTREIVGESDSFEVTLLIQNGTDFHSYQPSVKDIATIINADLLCYIGGTSDSWVMDAFSTTNTQTPPTISMLDAAQAEEELLTEGMQEERHSEEAEEEELDEHVWLSPSRAKMVCEVIYNTICQLDPKNAEEYKENYTAYLAKLDALDTSYQECIQNAPIQTILVADRFPFRYLVQDYHLTSFAAFPGCSTDSQASFSTIAFLSEKLRSLDLPGVILTESGSTSLAKTILENADSQGEIFVLDSLQSITRDQLDNGETYLTRMEYNLEILKQALGTV